MAELLGPRSLIALALPTGVDADYLMRVQMMEGMTAAEVIAIAAQTIGEANEYIRNNYGGLFSITERLWSRTRQGGGSRRMTPKGTEFAEEDGRQSDRVGHMLLVDDYKDVTAWSVDYLEMAIREDLRDDIMLKRDDWINRVEFDLFTRMFSKLEHAVGTAGWSVPWAIGTGTNVNFIPPQWRSIVHDNTHTHFKYTAAAATATNIFAAFETAAKELAHHGHLGQKIAYVSDAFADLILASNDKRFAVYIPAEFRLLSGNANAPIATVAGQLEGVPGEVIGYFTSKNGLVEVRRHDRVPADYFWMGKSYGIDNPDNPLAIRVFKKGFGLMVEPQTDKAYPPKLERVMFKGRHGVNVNDRTAGIAYEIKAAIAEYEEPTIV